jgi:hypothetical protein
MKARRCAALVLLPALVMAGCQSSSKPAYYESDALSQNSEAELKQLKLDYDNANIKSVQAYDMLVRRYELTGDDSNLTFAIQLHPERPRAIVQYAKKKVAIAGEGSQLYCHPTREYQQLIDSLGRFCQREPRNGEYALLYAQMIRVNTDRYLDTSAEFPRAIQRAADLLGEDNPRIRLERARLAMALGDVDKVQSLLAPLEKSNYPSAVLHSLLGMAAVARGDEPTGLEQFNESIERGGTIDACEALTMIAWKNKDDKLFRKYYATLNIGDPVKTFMNAISPGNTPTQAKQALGDCIDRDPRNPLYRQTAAKIADTTMTPDQTAALIFGTVGLAMFFNLQGHIEPVPPTLDQSIMNSGDDNAKAAESNRFNTAMAQWRVAHQSWRLYNPDLKAMYPND